MAPDCLFNNTGPAEPNVSIQWIMYYIFGFVLTLFAVPLYVQLNNMLNHALFCKLFHSMHGIFLHTFYGITRIYLLARDSKNITVQQDKTAQLNKQVLPPIDKFISIPNLPTITLRQKYSLQPTTTESSIILVPPENWAQADLQKDYRPLSPATINQDNAENSVSTPTLIQEVQPFLGITQHKTQQRQSATQPQEIADILGTTVFQGYVDTPLRTLDGLYVSQPQCFLPLAEEAKWLAEEIRKEQEVQQWAGIPHKQLLNQSFTDQLNCIQTLETLAPLQLAKQHLPDDIIDSGEIRLGGKYSI